MGLYKAYFSSQNDVIFFFSREYFVMLIWKVVLVRDVFNEYKQHSLRNKKKSVSLH